ncbi:MAG: hypothetical protein HRU03_02430 [Nanoarchaeales archaeon]|nr:hypothetical protein [Nanoarchaeales archaeon]
MGQEQELASIDVDQLQIIEDLQDKVDLLIDILEKNGTLGKGEFEGKYSKMMDEVYDK